MGLNIQHISPLFRVLRRQAFHTRHLTPEFQMGKPIGIGGGFFVQGVIHPAGFPGFVAPHPFEAVCSVRWAPRHLLIIHRECGFGNKCAFLGGFAVSNEPDFVGNDGGV